MQDMQLFLEYWLAPISDRDASSAASVGHARSDATDTDSAEVHPSVSAATGVEVELVARMRAGDLDAFEEMIRRYHDRLLTYLTYATGERDIAQDLLQDLYSQLWRGRARLPADGRLNLYLHGAARHRVLDRARGERRAGQAATRYADWLRWEEGPATSGEDAQTTLEQQELVNAVRDTVAALPTRSREVWHLHREQGLSYAEIAAVLGISVNTVKTLMTRTARAIRLAAAPFLTLLMFTAR